MITTNESRPVSELYAEMSEESLKRLEKLKQLSRLERALLDQLGREITDEEMAAWDEIDDYASQNIEQPGIHMWALEQYVKVLGGDVSEIKIKLPNQVFSLDMLDEPVATNIASQDSATA